MPKQTGVGSDGNINVSGGPKTLDLGDFDDIFGPLESDSPKQGPLGQFYTGLKESFSDRLKTKDIVRNFLRSAAPDGISNVMGFVDELGHASREIKDSLERTNASDLQYIAKRARDLLPKLQGKGYDEHLNKISSSLEDKIDEYDYTINSQKDQTAIRRARQEASDEAVIKEALDNISLTEKLNHNRSEQSANYRHQETRSENAIRDVLKTKRFDFTAKAMGQTVEGINRLVGYNEQVAYGIQKKELELSFRSYMGIKELVKLSEAQIELQVRAYNAIIQNTALTDFAKSQKGGVSELGKGNNRSFTSKAISKVLPKTLSGFLGGHGQEVQNRVGSTMSQKLSGMVQALKMGEMVPGDMWNQKYNIAGSVAGDFLGDFFLNDIIPDIGRQMRPAATKFSDKHGSKHNQLGYMLDNIPAFMQEFVNNGQNQYGMKGKLRDILAPFTPQFGLQDRLKDGTYQTIDQAAQFNQATQRSIVDGIPGYLARMLQELRIMRTGDSSTAREVFDLTSGKFTIQSMANDNLLNKIIPKSAVRVASSTINDALNTMDADGALSPEARKALSERLLRDASSNKRFDPEAFIKGRGFAEGTSPEVAKELELFFRNKFEFDESNKMSDTSSNQKLRQEFSQVFLDIRSISRDPVKEIDRLVSTGHTEPLRAMGIIITQDGIDKINYNRIWEILRSDVSGNNPYAPGGSGFDPNRPDNSGTKGHSEFMGPTHPGFVKAYAMGKTKDLRNRFAPEEQAARDAMAKHLKAGRKRFGSTMDAVNGIRENGLDYSKVLDGKIPGMYDSGISGYDKFVDKLPDMKSKLKGYGVDGMAALTDLYSQFDPTQPLIKGIDFSLGNLIDVNTKKVITKLSDITGEVINNQGQTVVTAAEAAVGLMTPKGEVVVKTIENASRMINDAIEKHQPNLGGKGKGTDQDNANSDEALNSQDWSLGPGENVVLASRKLANGEYRDAAGRVISSIGDISSDIFDSTGNLVLTAKEFAEGLWSRRTGKRYRPTKGFSKVLKAIKAGGKYSGTTASSLAWGALKFTAKTALGMASKAFNFLVENQNAYLEDNPIPVLTRRALKNGEYYDKKGNVVDDFVNVYSILYDVRGEPVVSPELYRDLKNYDGSKHQLAKNKSLWSKFVMRPLRAIKNGYMKLTKKYYGWLGRTAKSVGGKIGRGLFGGLAKRGGKIFDRLFDKVEDPNTQAQISATMTASEQQTEVLSEILQTLKEQQPEKRRKGSWQDKLSNSVNGASGKGEEGDDEQSEGLLGRGLKGLAGLLGLGKKDNDGDEEEDGGMLSDVMDLFGGGKKGKKGGKASMLKRALPYAAAGGALATLTGAELYSNRKDGMSWTQSLLTTGSKFIPGGNVFHTVLKTAFKLSNLKDLAQLRMLQYGIKSYKEQSKILDLEKGFEKYMRNSENPELPIGALGGKEILSILGIDLQDQAAVTVMSRWLDLRFKPVFLKWSAGLAQIGKPDIKVTEVDDKLPKELKGDFLELIRMSYGSDSPYQVTDNPFDPDKPLVDDSNEVKAKFEELTEKFAQDSKGGNKEVVKTETGKSAEEATSVTAAALTANPAKSVVKSLEAEGKSKVTLESVAKTAAGAGVSGLSGMVINYNAKIGDNISALQSIRMRAYGLQLLSKSQVRALLQLEAIYARDLVISGDSLDYNGDVKALLVEAGKLLGKDTTVGTMDRHQLYNWLIERFTPTFRAYYGTAKGLSPSVDLQGLETKLKGSDKITVAMAIIGAVYRHDQTVWESKTIFELTGPLDDLKRLAEQDLKFLKESAEKEVVNTPTQKGSDQMKGKNSADQGGSFTDRVIGTIKGQWDSAAETVSTSYNKAMEATKDAVASVKIATGLGGDFGGSTGEASGQQIQSSGNTGTIVEGNGGKWESIPYPSASGSIKAAYPTLKAVADMTGVPLNWLLLLCGLESSFVYKVANEKGSATGWFQFIKTTWDETYATYGPRFGCPPDPQKLRKERLDPRINALMGAMYIKQNWNFLKKHLKRDNISDVDLYMAHFLGAGGALKFLRADTNALGYKVFKEEYPNNPDIFFVNRKPSQPRTIGQIYQLFKDKISTFWATTGKGYQSGESISEQTPAPQTPGAANDEPMTEKERFLANLKADSFSDDGLAAKAKETDKTSVTEMARDTTILPGTIPTPSIGSNSSSTTTAGTDSSASVVDTQAQSQLAAATTQNVRRANELQQSKQTNDMINDIQSRQLNAVLEIRDLMRVIASQSKERSSSTQDNNKPTSAPSSDSMKTGITRNVPPMDRPSVLTMR